MRNPQLQIKIHLIAYLFVGMLLQTGCQPDGESQQPTNSTAPQAIDAHNHPTEGPHHGDLIELGNEEYHAELVHDEAAGSVAIYLLDSAATVPVFVEATELIVNLSRDGSAEQFALASQPQADDPSGKSSCFVSTDKTLIDALDQETAQAQLVVSINNKQYRGKIHHEHNQEAHGAAHEHDHDH